MDGPNQASLYQPYCKDHSGLNGVGGWFRIKISITRLSIWCIVSITKPFVAVLVRGGKGDNLQVPVDAQGLRATVDGQPVQIDDMPCMDNQA